MESAILFPRLTCSLPSLPHQALSCVLKGRREQDCTHFTSSKEVTCCLVNHGHFHATINNSEHLWRGLEYILCLPPDSENGLNFTLCSLTSSEFPLSHVDSPSSPYPPKKKLKNNNYKAPLGQRGNYGSLNTSMLLNIIHISQWQTIFQQQGNGEWDLVCENRWSLTVLWKNSSAPPEDQVI